MTEMTVHKPPLSPTVQRFVLHWGEMGAVWGTNRSVGQIHALLYLSEVPLTSEDIADTLGLARSNVSNSLKELLGLNLIRRAHVMGDRRDFYAAETDLWEMVTRIAEARKAREIDPTLAMLKACLDEAPRDNALEAGARKRIAAMHDFVAMVDHWAADIRRVPPDKLSRIIRLGGAIVKLIPGSRAGKAARGRD